MLCGAKPPCLKLAKVDFAVPVRVHFCKGGLHLLVRHLHTQSRYEALDLSVVKRPAPIRVSLLKQLLHTLVFLDAILRMPQHLDVDKSRLKQCNLNAPLERL